MKKLAFTKVLGILLVLTVLLAACSGNESAPANETTNDNKGGPQLIQETEHALFYSPDSKEDVSQAVTILGEAFENNYKRITELFRFEAADKTVIHVYSDKAEFEKMIGRSTEGTYVADENIIKVYTPSDLSDAAVKEDYTDQIIHEFVHAVIQQVNSTVGYVKWLDEGSAYYASNQLQKELQSKTEFLHLPDMEQLTSPEYFEEAGNAAYFYSGTIIKFIVDKYGEDAWNEILRQPDAIEEILKEPIEGVYEKWKSYLDNGLS